MKMNRLAMRCRVALVVLFVCTGVAFSAEPLEGTWEIDRDQTKFTAGASPPPGQILSIKQQGPNLLYTVTTPGKAGARIIIKYAVPVLGGEGKFEIGDYDRVFHRRIDAFTREASYFKQGKEVMKFRGVVAKDGRQLQIE